MSIQLLASLNGKKRGLLHSFLRQRHGLPVLAWYPSAGRDFSPLLLMSKPFADKQGLNGCVPAEPDLFIYTDYTYRYGQLETGTVLYQDAYTKMTIERFEELPELTLPLHHQLINDTPNAFFNKVFFMHVRIESAELGSFSCALIYAFAENAAFCNDVLLANRARIHQVFQKNWGRGLGGGASYGSWLINTLSRLGCELMVSWKEYDELVRDWDEKCDEVLRIYPALNSKRIPEFKLIYRLLSEAGNSTYWYGSGREMTAMNGTAKSYSALSDQERQRLERDDVIRRIFGTPGLNAEFYKTLPDALKSDQRIVESMARFMRQGHESLYHQLPREIQLKKSFVKGLLEFMKPSILPGFIAGLDQSLRNDSEILLCARLRFDRSPESVAYFYELLDGIHPELWKDVKFAEGVIRCCGNSHTRKLIASIHPKLFMENIELTQTILSRDGNNLRLFNAEVKNCKEIVVEAVRKNGNALQYASPVLQADVDVVLVAVNRNGEGLRYASERLRADREVAKAAVGENGNALKYVSDELRDDSECVLLAVGRNGGALQYASQKMKDTEDVVRLAIKRFPEAIQYASTRLQGLI